jgi:HSP90 family molecular chaperone
MPKIRVHERALAHLSRGLYRSPASALRELVSNAWDANATSVYVETNYPKFHRLSVEDNGEGFTRDDFDKLMRGASEIVTSALIPSLSNTVVQRSVAWASAC